MVANVAKINSFLKENFLSRTLLSSPKKNNIPLNASMRIHCKKKAKDVKIKNHCVNNQHEKETRTRDWKFAFALTQQVEHT